MFEHDNKFKRGDKVKFKGTDRIFPSLRGTVFCIYGKYHCKVTFSEGDNGHSHIFEDNDIDNFTLHRIHVDMLERWEE